MKFSMAARNPKKWNLIRLEAVEKALQRIDELTEDLLTVVQTGGQTADFDDISLANVAARAWESIDTRSASLETEDQIVTGDEGQVRALLENLFRNAIGHGGEAMTVRVGPLNEGFFVEDPGQGIPPEKREQVFKHGFSTGYGGSGVGLTVVSPVSGLSAVLRDFHESVKLPLTEER